ncbi:MAG: uroporphyrinogen-III synthase [Campylobacterota bacterium]|nr:uroporphyrinogen-III synthase [Campylobacterota bacterium]
MTKPIYLFSISSHPNAVSVNSLAITFLKPQIDFSKYDYLIITSKQTSEALKQYETQLYIEKKGLCVSVASAASYESLGGAVLDIGGGYGDDLAAKIKSYSKDTKWLYLRAKVVASDFVAVCKNEGYSIDEEIVYESDCSKEILDVKIEDESILIFTSPSSLNCFLKTHEISKKSKIIVIGKTTAKAVPKNREYILSKETTIDSCMEIASKL